MSPCYVSLTPRGRRAAARRIASSIPAALIAVCGFAGCGDPEPPEPRYVSTADARQDATSRTFRFPVAAPVADSLAVRDMVQRSAGRPVLLCFWSRFTDTHRVELQQLAALQRRHAAGGLHVISVNTDDPDDWIGYTRPTLLSVSANYPTVIVTPSTRSALRTWLNPKWSYDTPARFLFDGQGGVTASFLSDASFAAVEAAVSEAAGTSSVPVYESPARPRRSGATTDDRPQTYEPDRTTPDGADEGVAPVSEPPGESRRSATSGAFRTGVGLRLINVREGVIEGNYESLASDPSEAADALASQIAARLGGGSSRVAVLPLGDGDYAAPPTELGLVIAERLTRSLRLGGVAGVLTPEESTSALTAAGVTVGQAASEPTRLRAKLAADYLVVGWCRR